MLLCRLLKSYAWRKGILAAGCYRQTLRNCHPTMRPSNRASSLVQTETYFNSRHAFRHIIGIT